MAQVNLNMIPALGFWILVQESISLSRYHAANISLVDVPATNLHIACTLTAYTKYLKLVHIHMNVVLIVWVKPGFYLHFAHEYLQCH